MNNKFFNISDAHNEMTNLSQEMALVWAKVANTEYTKLMNDLAAALVSDNGLTLEEAFKKTFP